MSTPVATILFPLGIGATPDVATTFFPSADGSSPGSPFIVDDVPTRSDHRTRHPLLGRKRVYIDVGHENQDPPKLMRLEQEDIGVAADGDSVNRADDGGDTVTEDTFSDATSPSSNTLEDEARLPSSPHAHTRLPSSPHAQLRDSESEQEQEEGTNLCCFCRQSCREESQAHSGCAKEHLWNPPSPELDSQIE